MRRLSSLILLLTLSLSLTAQKSPHGESFKTNCSDCHKTSGWKVDLKGISFDHKATKFPLKGQHQDVTCKACHTSLEFAKTETECNACHTDMHQQTVGTDCGRCHTSDSWVVTNIIQIHRQSRFPLLGRHSTAECRDCHINLLSSVPSSPTASLLRFDPLGTDCYDCHRNNYLATTRPNHAQNNYATNCTICHNINSSAWSGANTTHTFFPLVDGHAGIPCNTCHTSGNYTNISNACASCHQTKYASTSNPNHAALGIANSCKDCHTLTPGWKPAKFTIHNTYYVLQGAHTTVDCNTCHKGTYPNTPTTCAGCHMTKYNATTNPSHAGSQFPTTCADCHTQSVWVPSTFNHTAYFPISSGKHSGFKCSECHTNASNYAVFACTTSCHPQATMAEAHQGRSGYSYTSPACLGCHPTGSSGGK